MDLDKVNVDEVSDELVVRGVSCLLRGFIREQAAPSRATIVPSSTAVEPIFQRKEPS
ncbi:MAG: hypothetical protein LZF60_380140 [Nitrospira sp.]|nr:MAG: hypothetical protein LZF60_380140 [Nitrospira sp.]